MINVARFCQRLSEPWHILPDTFAAIIGLAPLAARLIQPGTITITADTIKAIDAQAAAGAAAGLPKYDDRGVRVLSLAGTVGLELDEYERYAGGLDLDDIEKAIGAAVADEDVRAIVLAIDSPGGLHTGTPETAAFIAAAAGVKPVFAHTRRLMASCGYYLAAGCTAIYATGSALVGSVGTLIPLLDMSALYTKVGLAADVIASGPLKGTAWPGTTLTEEQRAYLQGIVDQATDDFKAHVAAYRTIDDEHLQGQALTGKAALAAGFIDSVASLAETIRDARAVAKTRQAGE